MPTSKSKATTEPAEFEALTHQLHVLNRKLQHQNAWHEVLVRSMIAGMGSAIGATIIAGIVIGVLSQTIRRIEDVPIVGNLIQNELIQAQFPDSSKE